MATKEESKIDKILKDIFFFLESHLGDGAMMELKDKLMAEHGIAHEVVSSNAYSGLSHAEDSALRPYSSPAVHAVQRFNEAVRICTPLAGAIPLACDSAEAVYAHTLRRNGIDTASMSPGSYREVVDVLRRRGSGATPPPSSAVAKSATAMSPA